MARSTARGNNSNYQQHLSRQRFTGIAPPLRRSVRFLNEQIYELDEQTFELDESAYELDESAYEIDDGPLYEFDDGPLFDRSGDVVVRQTSGTARAPPNSNANSARAGVKGKVIASQKTATEEETGSKLNRSEIEGLFCPICMEAWTNSGDHTICCLPCGHIYGMSCIKRWLEQQPRSGKCPQCNKKCKLKDIRVLYASRVVTIEEELQKKVQSLESKCASFESQVAEWSSKEIEWQKKEAELNLELLNLKEEYFAFVASELRKENVPSLTGLDSKATMPMSNGLKRRRIQGHGCSGDASSDLGASSSAIESESCLSQKNTDPTDRPILKPWLEQIVQEKLAEQWANKRIDQRLDQMLVQCSQRLSSICERVVGDYLHDSLNLPDPSVHRILHVMATMHGRTEEELESTNNPSYP